MDENPYESPTTVSTEPDSHDHRTELRKVARWQRRAIVAFLLNVAFLVTSFLVSGGLAPIAAGVLSFLGLVVIFACLLTVVPLAHLLYGTGVAIVCGLIMLVPLFSTVVLFIVIVKAGSSLRAEGIEAGMFGISADRIEPLP